MRGWVVDIANSVLQTGAWSTYPRLGATRKVRLKNTLSNHQYYKILTVVLAGPYVSCIGAFVQRDKQEV